MMKRRFLINSPLPNLVSPYGNSFQAASGHIGRHDNDRFDPYIVGFRRRNLDGRQRIYPHEDQRYSGDFHGLRSDSVWDLTRQYSSK
jgi:hypothetical protein